MRKPQSSTLKAASHRPVVNIQSGLAKQIFSSVQLKPSITSALGYFCIFRSISKMHEMKLSASQTQLESFHCLCALLLKADKS